MDEVMKRCYRAGVVPVVVLKRASDAVPAAKALYAGGIDVMEITMRTEAALDAIYAVSTQCPEILVGAGTVIDIDQCSRAREAGAKFIVSPGFDSEMVACCVENGVPVLPGCVTPSEIMLGLKLGIKVFKFFPANVYGGLKAMKSLAGPFGGVKFMPTGGVGADNLEEYLKAPFIQAVGGSWLCAASDIEEGNWDKITHLTSEAAQIRARCR